MLSSKKRPVDPDETSAYTSFQNGDPAAIEKIFKQYRHLVFGLCLNYLKNEEDARDAVMDVFYKLTKSRNGDTIQHFKSYLYTTTKNHCLDLLKSKKHKKTLHQEAAQHHAPVMEFTPSDRLNNEVFTDEQVREAIDQLDDAQRQCIRLFYLDEKSYREICENTGFETKQVKSYLQNGRRNLKQILSKIRGGGS